jgi:NodT family efflux transporter outer membrane factor (OMF) lipoprotein
MKATRCILAAALLPLAACDLAPKYEKPKVDTGGGFKEAVPPAAAQGWKIAQPNDSVIRGNWWEEYGDADLNDLEERVAISNQTVAQAEANYRSARALVGEARANLFPAVSVNPSVTRARSSSSTSGSQGSGSASVSGTNGQGGASVSPGSGSSGNGPNPKTTYTLPFEASYVVDLWGSVRNQVAQARYSAQASAANVAGALLSTHVALAQDYFSLRAADEQRRILGTTLSDYEASLHLVRTLYNNGLASEEDLAEADTQLDSAEAQLTDLGIARAQFEHAIAVLIGVPPSRFSVPIRPFSKTLPTVPLGLASELLERRPDVAAAERQVAAANANIGIARAAYFPNLTISGYAGWQSNSLSKLLDWPSRIWSVGPTLAQPLFDGGLRMSENEQARAQYDATVANYRQVVLTSFQAVEDNLAGLRILSREVVQLHSAAVAAQHAVQLSVVRYQNGLDSYVNVITAQNTFLSSRLSEIQVELRQLTSTVALVGNLGGGWDTTQWSQTERMALHPEGAGRDAVVPAEYGGTPVANPPDLPEAVKRPEDILKQDEADMDAQPGAKPR